MKIQGLELIKTEQQNHFYDPALSCNGGGYDQPEFTYEGPAGKLVISDMNCGDFGARYAVVYTDPAGETYRYYYDYMGDRPYEEDGIPLKYAGIIRFCESKGYPVRPLLRKNWLW